MQFKKVNFNNLPKEAVLAYNGTDKPKIGVLLRDDETTVLCSSEQGDLLNVTHYILLDEIKPSEPKVKTYFMFAALRYCGGALNTGLSQRACNVELPINESLDNVIDEWLTEIRNEVAQLNNVDFKDVIITSFSCTETT